MTSRKRLSILVSLALALWFGRDFLLNNTGARGKPVASAIAAARSAARAAAAVVDAPVCSTPAQLPQRGLLVAAGEADPFSPTQREVVRPPPPPPPPPVAIVAPPPPAPPPPPQLPYRYYGTMKERGLPASVFLAANSGALIQAKAGDVLEGGYRLESIAPRELIFLHLQQNLTLRLGVDGESTWP